MLMMVVSTLLALVAAAVVLVVASVAGGPAEDGPTSVRGYLDDVRAGLRSWRAQRSGHTAPVAAEDPVDSTFDDFFAATAVQDPAYLAVEDLTDTLARARERAARGVQGLARR